MAKQTIKNAQDLKQLGTILSVWAHPDDESFSCGGLMYMATGNGQRVVCVTATKGEKGVQDESRWPAARLAEIRAQEMAAASKVLGLKEHHWLGYIDGLLAEVEVSEGAERVARFIEEVNPQTILTFPPDGITGHTDHIAISKWVEAALEKLGRKDITVLQAVDTQETYDEFLETADQKLNIYFNLDKPNLVPHEACDMCVHLEGETLRRKLEALRAMPSQTEAMFKQFGDTWAEGAFACESFCLAASLEDSSQNKH